MQMGSDYFQFEDPARMNFGHGNVQGGSIDNEILISDDDDDDDGNDSDSDSDSDSDDDDDSDSDSDSDSDDDSESESFELEYARCVPCRFPTLDWQKALKPFPRHIQLQQSQMPRLRFRHRLWYSEICGRGRGGGVLSS